jgi:hypothetical protein
MVLNKAGMRLHLQGQWIATGRARNAVHGASSGDGGQGFTVPSNNILKSRVSESSFYSQFKSFLTCSRNFSYKDKPTLDYSLWKGRFRRLATVRMGCSPVPLFRQNFLNNYSGPPAS